MNSDLLVMNLKKAEKEYNECLKKIEQSFPHLLIDIKIIDPNLRTSTQNEFIRIETSIFVNFNDL